jgi:hypothetical protein
MSMRKNLTISLSMEDWKTVRAIAESVGETYSRVFHRLIELGTGVVSDDRRIAKYKAALAPHSKFLTARAKTFARAGKRKRQPA